MFSTSTRSISAYKVLAGFAYRLLMTVTVFALLPVALAQSGEADGTDDQSFFVLDNPGDPNFNQLLGINDGLSHIRGKEYVAVKMASTLPLSF